MGRGANASTLSRRINEQISYVQRRLQKHTSNITQYYWGETKLNRCGIAATPASGRSVIAQLLVTPKLIVDILPLPKPAFVDTYGVDASQMYKLAAEGFIIPNIYHYKNDGWREYLPFQTIAELLSNYGRPNTEWITRYLNSIHNFQDIERRFSDFFREITIPNSEQRAALKAFHCRVDEWERFTSVAGQRLAYIQVLAGPHAINIVEKIQEYYLHPDHRIRALRLLNASKYLLATETTAAFGGCPTDTEEQITDFRMSVTDLQDLTETDRDQLENKRSHRSPSQAEIEFAVVVAERCRKVKIPLYGEPKHSQTSELSKAQFRNYMKVLRKVGDGRLGQLTHKMSVELMDPNINIEPTLDEYRQMARELNDGLKKLPVVASALNKVGTYLYKAVEQSPLGDGSMESVLLTAGTTAHFLAGWVDDIEMIPLFKRKYPRQLYATWRLVKSALKI